MSVSQLLYTAIISWLTNISIRLIAIEQDYIYLFMCSYKDHIFSLGLPLTAPKASREFHQIRQRRIWWDDQSCTSQPHSRPLERPGTVRYTAIHIPQQLFYGISSLHAWWFHSLFYFHELVWRYLDDIPPIEGELYAGVVFSDHAHATISVDPSTALAMEGVVDYVCVDDVPGDNMIGMTGVQFTATDSPTVNIGISIYATLVLTVYFWLYNNVVYQWFFLTGLSNDEPVFADGKVINFGQIIGLILARTKPLAQRAARAVKVTYEDMPSIITIEV